MSETKINAAVGSFVDEIKKIAKSKEAAKLEQQTKATVDEGCPKPPKPPHKPPHKPVDCDEAVKRFRNRIECALKGDHAAKEILEAVWQLLKDLGIECHK